MEQIIFIAIVVVVGLVRLIAQAAENKRNADAQRRGSGAPVPRSTTPAPSGAPQTEEERVRKFFEALGVPTSADPPPRVQPRQVTPKAAPKRKILPVDPFPKPRRLAEARTATVAPSPPPLPPVVEIPPLPTRETTVLASPRKSEPDFPRPDFEVRDLDEGIAEDAFTHAGLRKEGGKVSASVERGSFVARLGTPQALRDAIVLREIFGPPRSMQPLTRPTAG